MTERQYFPLFVDISEKEILFVGGGKIAARRINALAPFTQRITIVAPEADGSILGLTEEGEVSWIMREFEDEDLEEKDLVFAATDDAELNEQIALMCRQKGIPVNVSSDKILCDFYFPRKPESDKRPAVWKLKIEENQGATCTFLYDREGV